MVSKTTWQEITNLLNANPNVDNRPLKRVLKRGLVAQPCPSCLSKISIYDAAGPSYDIRSVYYGAYTCPNCGRGLRLVSPFVNEPPGWRWELGTEELNG